LSKDIDQGSTQASGAKIRREPPARAKPSAATAPAGSQNVRQKIKTEDITDAPKVKQEFDIKQNANFTAPRDATFEEASRSLVADKPPTRVNRGKSSYNNAHGQIGKESENAGPAKSRGNVSTKGKRNDPPRQKSGKHSNTAPT
jgi:hypothetical protein